MTDEIARIATDGAARIGAVDTLDELHEVEIELLGKRSALATRRQQLGCPRAGRAPHGRPGAQRGAIGVAGGRSTSDAPALEASARAELARGRAARSHRVHAPRPPLRPPHLVTQAWERLEDVFIGLGFQIAEGPEVEDDWHNFGALNFPPDHPARDMYDTLYLDYGDARLARCCARTRRRCRSG